MIALILAAGYATRLYPLTIDTPKPLLQVGPKCMIDYIVDEIDSLPDITKIVVVTNHRFADQFEQWAEKRMEYKRRLFPIQVVDDGTTDDSNKLGAIGDIQFVIEKLHINEDLMIIAGDNLFTYKLRTVYDYFNSKRKDTLVAIRVDDIEQLKKLAVATLDEDSKVLYLAEKPEIPRSTVAIYATYFYLRETLPLFSVYLDEGNSPDAPGHFPSWLYQKKDVYALRVEGTCIDIGTPENYKDVCENYKTILGIEE